MDQIKIEKLFNLEGVTREPKFKNGWYQKDILSVNQFDKAGLSYIFTRAEEMAEMVEKVGACDLLKGYVQACVFYEPSTRTSSSFIGAMERLGGSTIPITQGIQYSSVSKGESLVDTMLTLEKYADIIVLRHPEIGSAAQAAKYASVPIINAGDGAGEHPTQALLDLYTIRKEFGRIDGLKVAMLGDLRNGRTVHSLTKLLENYDVSLRYVSPDTLRLPLNLMNELINKGIDVRETDRMEDIIKDVDVLYVTRIQKERFTDMALYEEVKNYFEITEEVLAHAKKDMIVMHPLPRVGEIHYKVDRDPRAAYFRQVRNGMFVRMALLASVLGEA
ncbi:aspartate carbamoyltransferase [Pelolinea submarina]|jgi:carbamoyl-phosphate synthase/aspartate carbamoyltransferase/dihydroorotase/carbamoyl-phosphate synthase/aspartate carbamoyltransferase|uniref:Aspartate carbamoyltransferase n=1 Tax=Pelolinea submarina TaxID=913107 RepID=A0A347ZV37_9CHLR|nr:aspartate carbamoyltransferase [Pelolinea submarina]REG10246.1 aspartate carbamoyltransferase [Pelolinea submarina]BBB49168.1 carbamoyl-phosphate synthase /aspartate carbamoyltransferase /dihydroorotase [Pelolinea submarina]